jgi:hypothetical protein
MASVNPDYTFPAVDATLQATASTTVDERKRKTNELMTKIQGIETSTFDSVYAPATTASQNVLTYSILLDRNNTIKDIATDLTNQNNSKMTSQRDTYTRQAEINEWEANDKMDTLFFLQLFFVYLSALVVSLYLRQTGLFPSSIVNIIAFLGLLVLGLVLWNRASYTSSSRDKRYWNRRYLGLGDSNLQSQIQCNISN